MSAPPSGGPPPDDPVITWSEILDSRVMIIDDEQANIDLLEALLRREGYRDLVSVTDPRKAIAAYTSNPPDIILLDLMMPGLDGYGLLEALQRLVPPGDYLPVLVLTADPSVEARRRALSLGARDFVSKPFDLIEVALRIGNLLEMRMLYQRLQSRDAPA